jgi:hypothetical protein
MTCYWVTTIAFSGLFHAFNACEILHENRGKPCEAIYPLEASANLAMFPTELFLSPFCI